MNICCTPVMTCGSIIVPSMPKTSTSCRVARAGSRPSGSAQRTCPTTLPKESRSNARSPPKMVDGSWRIRTFVLEGLTYQRATFTERDVGRYLLTRTDGTEQFQAANLKIMTSPEMVALGR